MRTHLLVALSIFCAAAAGAQTSTSSLPSTQASATGDKPMVLVGCVVADKTNGDRITLSDPKAGINYRLRGKNVAIYSGRRVRIIGGLFPSPNVAAQAGAIDPTRAAMAAAEANRNGAGYIEPLEFRITRLWPLAGSCAPR